MMHGTTNIKFCILFFLVLLWLFGLPRDFLHVVFRVYLSPGL